MPNTTITGLPVGSAATGTEPLPLDQSGATVKLTIDQIIQRVSGAVLSSPIPAQSGGTGGVSGVAHSLVLWEGGSALSAVATGASGLPLISNGGALDPSYQLLPATGLNVSGAVANTLLLWNGGAALTVVATGTAGLLLTSNGSGSAPSFQSFSVSGLPSMPAYTFLGNPTSGTVTPSNITLDQAAAMFGFGVEPQGRLTLATATPVMTSTVSGQTTVYYTPYTGHSIPLYDGTQLIPTLFNETTNVTTNSSSGNAGPAAVAATGVYDLFVWTNASGVPTLTRGYQWASLTARNVSGAMTRTDGLWLNASGITNGPAALRGTYVGTIAANASATIDYILAGSASGGASGSYKVYNAYNRVDVGAQCIDSGSSYTYTSNVIRQSRATSGNQISYVDGLGEDRLLATYTQYLDTAAAIGATTSFYIGLDSLVAGFGPYGRQETLSASNQNMSFGFSLIANPGIGVHTFAALEASDNTNANTFNTGNNGTLTVSMRL